MQTAKNLSESARELVSLDRYPIEDLNAPQAKALVAHCREQLDKVGACELKNFVTDRALKLLAHEGASMEGEAFFNAIEANAYLDEPDPALPADHVRRMTEPTSLGAIAYDQFPLNSLLRGIYEWDPLMLFIGRVLGLEEIYRYADPMGGLNLSVMRDGDYLRWHFDQTDFVSSLMVRNSQVGGHFEYVPMIRDDQNENYPKVRAILEGGRQGVITLANAPGSLVLFKGRHSLHRVTPIHGGTSRLIGLFGFDSKPGVMSSDHLRKIRYGRTQVFTPR